MQPVGNQFWVSVVKGPEDSLGIEVEVLPSLLMINAVDGGLFAAWNAANPDLLVKASHHMVQVNDARGCGEELFNELTHASAITMLICSCTSWQDAENDSAASHHEFVCKQCLFTENTVWPCTSSAESSTYAADDELATAAGLGAIESAEEVQVDFAEESSQPTATGSSQPAAAS